VTLKTLDLINLTDYLETGEIEADDRSYISDSIVSGSESWALAKTDVSESHPEMASISRRMIWNKRNEEFVRIDQPEGLLKEKEIPFAVIMRDGIDAHVSTVRKKQRAHAILRLDARRAREFCAIDEFKDKVLPFRDIHPEMYGTYMPRKIVEKILKLDDWGPKLGIPKRFFAGRAAGLGFPLNVFDRESHLLSTTNQSGNKFTMLPNGVMKFEGEDLIDNDIETNRTFQALASKLKQVTSNPVD
jgi:hypothetical protein